MKYVNYLIIILMILFVSIWSFNHINAWIGIGIAFLTGYFLVSKLFNLSKENTNEKV